MSSIERSAIVKRLAAEQGFDRCGIAPLGLLPRGDYYLDWLANGMAGTMGYLHRRRESRLDPSRLLPGARTAIVVAANYFQASDQQEEPGTQDSVLPRGRIALYAWGEDYHLVLHERLESLLSAIRTSVREPFDAKICVDTSAIIERELAAAAGIGWIGKNTLVLHPSLGSCFFLGEILTTLDLAADVPVADHCGRCTACLDACPTQAFHAPYRMDATRCISYLTIEHRGEIAPELRSKMGDWIFGCDICQQVCPFNRDPPPTREARFAARPLAPAAPLTEVAAWDDTAHAAATQGRALDRATPSMWRRNAAIALNNAV